MWPANNVTGKAKLQLTQSREGKNVVLLMITQMMSCFYLKMILTHEFMGSTCCFRIRIHCFSLSSTPLQCKYLNSFPPCFVALDSFCPFSIFFASLLRNIIWIFYVMSFCAIIWIFDVMSFCAIILIFDVISFCAIILIFHIMSFCAIIWIFHVSFLSAMSCNFYFCDGLQ